MNIMIGTRKWIGDIIISLSEQSKALGKVFYDEP